MRVAVVVLNWNTVGYLRDFVPGILESLGSGDALVVADSGSTDGSLEYLEQNWPQVLRVPLEGNYGFAQGYNLAMERLAPLKAEYYLLLNSDVQVQPGWLEPLVGFMEQHPGCAICGPKLHALDKGPDGWVRTDRFEYAGAAGGCLDALGYPYCRGRILKKVEQDKGQYDSLPSGVAWVTGAALMIRRSAWESLGGFDGEFFAHMEEIDLCWRAQLRGWTVDVVPESLVWHIGGGTLPQESPFKLKLNFRNSLWMLRRNLPSTVGPARAFLKLTARRLLDWGSALVYLLGGRHDFAKAVVQAHRDASRRHIEPCGCTGPRPRVLSGKLILLNFLNR